jgi:hypothetical protein
MKQKNMERLINAITLSEQKILDYACERIDEAISCNTDFFSGIKIKEVNKETFDDIIDSYRYNLIDRKETQLHIVRYFKGKRLFVLLEE